MGGDADVAAAEAIKPNIAEEFARYGIEMIEQRPRSRRQRGSFSPKYNGHNVVSCWRGDYRGLHTVHNHAESYIFV